MLCIGVDSAKGEPDGDDNHEKHGQYIQPEGHAAHGLSLVSFVFHNDLFWGTKVVLAAQKNKFIALFIANASFAFHAATEQKKK
jgi:hypothetical protein